MLLLQNSKYVQAEAVNLKEGKIQNMEKVWLELTFFMLQYVSTYMLRPTL